MIQAGANITQKDDLLSKVQVDYLYHSIRNPKKEVSALIRQLRMIRTIDSKQYSTLKKELPYFVCGVFNPPFRRTENFAFIEYFIIDIDHVSEKELSIEDLKQRFKQDKRIVMCFVSPSEDGLKVMFKLDEKCYDSGLYSLFYKAFSKYFSSEYSIEQVIDLKTSDVCRACFVSEDPNVFFNPDANAISLQDFLDLDSPFDMFFVKSELENEIISQVKDSSKDAEDKMIDPDAEIIVKIKEILNPGSIRKREKPPVYVPQQIEEIFEDLKKYIEATGVVLYEALDIQYGKKLRFRTNYRVAEINIFYGKRGFSVVKAPRSGTSDEMNNLMVELVKNFIYENFI